MHHHFKATSIQIVAFAALYVALYELSGKISHNEGFAGVASIFFLPAFVRLLAFLTIGFWSIPALFIAALFCVDLGLDMMDRTIVSAFLAVGAPIGIAISSNLIKLTPSLESLTARQLLWLSIGSALGSSVSYHLGLTVIGFDEHNWSSQWYAFVGDVTGTWAIIYLIKIILTIYGRSLRPDGSKR